MEDAMVTLMWLEDVVRQGDGVVITGATLVSYLVAKSKRMGGGQFVIFNRINDQIPDLIRAACRVGEEVAGLWERVTARIKAQEGGSK